MKKKIRTIKCACSELMALSTAVSHIYTLTALYLIESSCSLYKT